MKCFIPLVFVIYNAKLHKRNTHPLILLANWVVTHVKGKYSHFGQAMLGIKFYKDLPGFYLT